jgi:hypothetical protein
MHRTAIKSKYCKNCRKRTAHHRYVTAMGCGDLFMVIITLGLWVVLRALFTPGYHCSVCGR